MFRFMFVFAISFLVLSVPLFSQTDKAEVYNRLVEKYGNMSSVSMKFRQKVEEMEVDASLTAKRQNKYALNLSGRVIVCNGKTIWNYDAVENTVIISNFERFEYEVSIEEFFFSFLNNYKPSRLLTQATSDGRYVLILALSPESADKMINGVSYIEVWLDKNSYDIVAIEVDSDIGKQHWDFDYIKVNPDIAEDKFEYTPPEDSKVIDLR